MSMEYVSEIADILINEGRSISVAESCTGGLLSAALTSKSGASQWMKAGITAYTEECKRGLLGLTDKELGSGLVTEACAKGMVMSIAQLTGSDYAISTTGVCDASSEGFNPCTVWICIKTPYAIEASLIRAEDRGRVKNMSYAVEKALELMLNMMRKEGL